MEKRKLSDYENANISRIIDIIFYVAITAVFIVILFYGKPVYAINDDLGLYNVLSGAFTGKADAHISFMEYPLSWGLAMLYQVWEAVPWYGIFLESVLLVCVILGYHRCTILLRKTYEHLMVDIWIRVLFCAAWFCILLIPMLRLQYTVVSGVWGSTALFLFVSSEDSKSVRCFIRENIGTIFLGLLCESIRPEMLYMLLGFAGALWLGRFIYALVVKKQYLLYVKNYLTVLGIFIVALGAILLCSHFAYSDTQWQSYREIDRYRVKLFDYYGYPSYDSYEEYFRKYGIDKANYEAVANLHMYVGRDLNSDQWQQWQNLHKTFIKMSIRCPNVFQKYFHYGVNG